MRHPEEAASELFGALQRFAPHILGALRDAKGQRPIDAWASANRIAYRSVIWGAEHLRAWWGENPRKAQDLRIVKVICGIAAMPKPLPPAEERWLSAVWPTVEPPDPMAESLADWLRRARTLYRDRQKIIWGSSRKRTRRKRAASPRDYGWFVRVHVLGGENGDHYQAKVAREDHVSAATVSRGIRKVIAELDADNYSPDTGRRRGARDLKPRKERSDAL